MLPASIPAPADVLAAVNRASARNAGMRLDLHWFATVDSTMDVTAEAAQAGAAEGLVVVAEEQTHGRGRRGHAWSSPAGAGLYLTFLLRPPTDAAARPVLSLVTLAAGVAVADAIARSTSIAAELKWPNDVMIEGRKLAGILAEGLAIGTPAQVILVGIGVNVRAASHPADVALRATSLEREMKRPVDRAAVLEELLVALPERYDALRRGNAGDILQAWRRASPSARGRAVQWHSSGGTRCGVTAGIDDSGALLVTTDAGTERLLGGELTWM